VKNTKIRKSKKTLKMFSEKNKKYKNIEKSKKKI
jgi:hypothetical protein